MTHDIHYSHGYFQCLTKKEARLCSEHGQCNNMCITKVKLEFQIYCLLKINCSRFLYIKKKPQVAFLRQHLKRRSVNICCDFNTWAFRNLYEEKDKRIVMSFTALPAYGTVLWQHPKPPKQCPDATFSCWQCLSTFCSKDGVFLPQGPAWLPGWPAQPV